MTFTQFSQFLSTVEQIASRNELTVMVADFLKQLDQEEVSETMYLMGGRLAPTFVDLEFNVSRKLILKALDQVIQQKGLDVLTKELFKELGDVGLVAESIRKDIEEVPEELSIMDVYASLSEIANFEGKGSTEQKINGYIDLFTSLDPLSTRFVTRMIIGGLRLGISDKTILDALSWFHFEDKSLRKILDLAFGAKADIGELTKLVISKSTDQIQQALELITLEVGTPVASKLVEREKDPVGVWKRMPNCFVQPKLDGLRGQIHYKKDRLGNGLGTTALFSRNMENMTDQFPELVEAVSNLGVDSIVLDSEIIGFDEKTGEYLSYQETMQRKRKHEVEEFAKEVPVKAMCFDILYLNSKDLTREPIEERIKLLRESIFKSETERKTLNLDMLETIQMESLEQLDDYFTDKVMGGLEGIITKEPGTDYEPGTRNFKWIKLKANTKSELVDTIDVTVIGYYIGRGQRAKSGIGALLAAVYDPETEIYQSVGKVGSGMTDKHLDQIKKDLAELEVSEMPGNVDVAKPLYPDVWVRPEIVMEIVADEITRSPSHTAAKGVKTKVKNDKSDRGLSVRFPRMKVWKRDKKLPNTTGELVRMYELRKS